MIEVRKLIPQVYNQSRDFSIFTGEMQILLNELDVKSLILSKLPVEDILPYKLSNYTNLRSYFRLLLKNKGSLLTILRAIVLSGAILYSFDEESKYLEKFGINTDNYFDRVNLPISARSNEGEGFNRNRLVYYESYENNFHQIYVNLKDPNTLDQDLLSKLFYYIKPVNTQVILKAN